MSTVQLYTDSLLKRQSEAITLLIQLNMVKNRGEILQLRADIEKCIKDMKAIYFDLVEAGGPEYMKAIIKNFERQYLDSPNFDDQPQNPAVTEATAAAQEQATTSEKIDPNHMRMIPKNGGRRFHLEPYEPIPSTLDFQSGDIIRTPMESKGLIMPAWFYVDHVIKTPGGVTLRGWRLGESDQMARAKYKDRRIIQPDQYTFIARRGVSREEVGLDQFV